MHLRSLLAATLAGLAAALVAACGTGEAPSSAGGVTTRTPEAATTTATTAAATDALQPVPTTSMQVSTPVAPPTAEPDEVTRALAALGNGEDPRVVAGTFALVEPRCEESREELARVVEQGWRILNEQRRVAAPVTSILTRMALAFPPGTQRFGCDSILAAVIRELSP